MVAESTLRRLEAEFDTAPAQLQAIVDLLDAGASPQFVALFRRDETGDPGEDRLVAIHERLRFLNEIERRKDSLVQLAEQREAAGEAGVIDAASLRAMLADSVDQDLVDDIDHAMRPREHKAEARLGELGLLPLYQAILRHELGERLPQDAAQEYVNAERGLNDSDQVLAQVVLALAERFGEDPSLRASVRAELARGILEAKATPANDGAATKPGAERYASLAGLEEPVRKIPAPRMLALRRAEREGFLTLRLRLEAGRELELFRARFSPDVAPDSAFGGFLDLVYGHAYDHHVHRACEERVRHQIKEKADREQVRAFSRSLRAQLSAPGSGDKAVAALRVAGKSVWLAIVAEDGSPKVKRTFGIPDEEAAQGEMRAAIVEALREQPPGFVVVPHGRREGAARTIAQQVIAALPEDMPKPTMVAVDETSSLVWATSAQARRRHGSSDAGLRTTLSLARRVHDPLYELMRVDIRGLGLGEKQAEVHQGLLRRQLDAAISSCLARIGVDVNRADPALLARVPGIARDLAQAIVKERTANGPFKSLAELSRVAELDEQRRGFVAGFLRVHGGEDPYDATCVPPENRGLVEKIAAMVGKPAAELIGHPLPRLDLAALAVDGIGPCRVRDTLDAIQLGTRDPRGSIVGFGNQGVGGFDDLKVDQELQGRVTNLTEFGAFVDLGIAQDGLIHVSQIPPARLRDPDRALRVGEVVTVYVLNLDAAKKKVGLSLFKPRHLREGRPATLGERLAAGGGGRRERRGQGGPEMQSRAARPPEGQRGGRRGGPGQRPGGAGGGKPRGERPHEDEGGRGGEFRRGPRPSGGPRVYTVESEKAVESSLGKKGELRSLSGLRALLGKAGEDAPAETPKPE
ncbi:MAG: Tex-like N-terminal domain-containing protein [Planctomycetota bacterium]